MRPGPQTTHHAPGLDHGPETRPGGRGRSWTFLTNHARVLICIARAPDSRLRDLAAWIGITERAVQDIVGDLVAEGYLLRNRTGRRNTYKLNPELPFRHPIEADHQVSDLISLFTQLANPIPRTGDS